MPKLKLITFGCQTNELDSERIAGVLSESGYELTDQEEEADLILLNTCSIRKKAEDKFYSQLGRLGTLKRGKRYLRIGVCGCIAEQEGEGLRRRFPIVDLVIGTGRISQIPSLLSVGKAETTGPIHPLRSSPVKAWIEIMKGCNNFCAYCVVPYLRGREESHSPEEILQEIADLKGKGYREIVLLGHNVNSYGRGLFPPVDFRGLLHRIDTVVSDSMWVRFTTSHPKDLTPELARCFSELPALCEHIHLPVQSGSDQVLARMNRGYLRGHFLGIMDELRRWTPNIAVTTDIMVGFPGESERDFQATLSLLEEVRFDRIFSFKYSSRPRTKALSLPDHLPERVKEDRLSQVINLQNSISHQKNRAILGETVQVLVEKRGSKRDQGMVTSRTRANQVVHFADPRAEAGAIVRVRILEASAFHLKGEAIQ